MRTRVSLLYSSRMKKMKFSIVAFLVLLATGYIAYAGYRDQAARNQLYRAVLDEYGRKLHPGMTRDDVHQFLNQGHTEYSSGLLLNGGNSRSDKINIGIEPTGRFGAKEQVYIALD